MFAVLVTSAIPDHLHGYLSRFLTEVEGGVYVGNISPVVRDHIWERVREAIGDGTATIINSDNSREQGFSLETFGQNAKTTIDLDGLTVLAYRPGRAAQKLKSTSNSRHWA